MSENNDRIEQLLARLEILLHRQEAFSQEVQALRNEIQSLAGTSPASQDNVTQPVTETRTPAQPVPPPAKPKPPQSVRQPRPPRKPLIPAEFQKDMEKFIGENLISKIGILILVIGVAIGAKYSIDNNLISPLTHIILGYMGGIALLGFGIKLREKYEKYSAVLVSGAMAIFYFLTFAAYSFYGLIPQTLTFGMMVIFTVFTVLAALSYNQQMIAHIGLVGAYAVPFLLSDGSGKVGVLFSYMAIINSGILFIAFKRYWKPLYYVAFAFTWLIFLVWLGSEYQVEQHFALGLTFAILFFAIFYAAFLAYKLIRNEKYEARDVQLLLANSAIFYGAGYAILNSHETGTHLLGLFTLLNAVVHFGISVIFYRRKQADRSLFYLASGLVLAFITIAIPVQLDGNFVTLLWAAEAALLYWIGRTKEIPFYEKLSYPLMLLAFFSLVQDWGNVYGRYYLYEDDQQFMPLLNIHFLSSILFTAAFGFISYLQRTTNMPSALGEGRLAKIAYYAIPAVFLYALYSSFNFEIHNYFDQRYANSLIPDVSREYGNTYNYDLNNFKSVWSINYTLLFLSLMAYVNITRLKHYGLSQLNFGLLGLAIAVFLLGGLSDLGVLRDSYINQTLADVYNRGPYHILIRYISYGFLALALWALYKYSQQDYMNGLFEKPFDALLYGSTLWIASSELIQWLDLAGVESDKLGLSILWGIYSLALIALGIWKSKKHLRIGAIALFAVTLAKLFLYDIAHLDTISKTVVFIALGLLLLLISFLYNKYKHLISDESEDEA